MVYALGGRICAWPCPRFPLPVLLRTRRLSPLSKHDRWRLHHHPDRHLRLAIRLKHVCPDHQSPISLPKPVLRPDMVSEAEGASTTLLGSRIWWIPQGCEL